MCASSMRVPVLGTAANRRSRLGNSGLLSGSRRMARRNARTLASAVDEDMPSLTCPVVCLVATAAALA